MREKFEEKYAGRYLGNTWEILLIITRWILKLVHLDGLQGRQSELRPSCSTTDF